MACSSTASTWPAASRPSSRASSASTLSADEAHALFLGKTVDGVLDAIAARTGTRPSARLGLQLGFRHRACLSSRAGGGRATARRRRKPARRGHRMAVASQSSLARVRFSLDVTGLARAVRRARLRHIDGAAAQARARYLSTGRRRGSARRPADCVVIEDSPAGAAAALAAGMRAIGYAPGTTHAAMRASGAQVIRSMAELARSSGAGRGFPAPLTRRRR